jgi:uncharacterized membrane protein
MCVHLLRIPDSVSVMAEIACRALSPAVTIPVLRLMSLAEVFEYSAYAQNKIDETEVIYPSVHVAPLQIKDLLEDFFYLLHDGASMGRFRSLRTVYAE